MPRERGQKLIANNKRARYDYFIDDVYEAGIVLSGTEVKALRQGKASLTDSYAAVDGGELWLENAYIPEFTQAPGPTMLLGESASCFLLKKTLRSWRESQRKPASPLSQSVFTSRTAMRKSSWELLAGKSYSINAKASRREMLTGTLLED